MRFADVIEFLIEVPDLEELKTSGLLTIGMAATRLKHDTQFLESISIQTGSGKRKGLREDRKSSSKEPDHPEWWYGSYMDQRCKLEWALDFFLPKMNLKAEENVEEARFLELY